MANREAKTPMHPDQIFRICSMTKPITRVAVRMLYEEGRFLLNDPVSNFIPEFQPIFGPQISLIPGLAVIRLDQPAHEFRRLNQLSSLDSRLVVD